MERQPTEKQLAYIQDLARQTNTSLYTGNIRTVQEASKVIDDLKQKRKAAGAPVRAAYARQR